MVSSLVFDEVDESRETVSLTDNVVDIEELAEDVSLRMNEPVSVAESAETVLERDDDGD